MKRLASPVFGGSLTTIRLLPGVDIRLTSAVALSVLARAAIAVWFIVAAGAFIGSVPAAVREGLSSPAGGRMVTGIISVAVVFVVSMIVPGFQNAIAESLGRRLDGKLRTRVMTGVMAPVGIAHLEEPSVQDQLSLAEGVGPGRWTPGDSVVGLADNLAIRLQVLAAAGLLGMFRWWLAAFLVASGAILRSRLVTEGSKRLKVLIGEAEALRRSDYFRDLALTPVAAKETRLFGLSNWILETFSTLWLTVMAKLWAERKRDAGSSLIWFVPVAAATLVSFAVVGGAAAGGEIDLGRLVILAQAIVVAGGWSVTNSDLLVEYGAAAVGPALELEASGVRGDPAVRGLGDASGMPQRGIVFESVAFKYPGQGQPVFSHLDLVVDAGRSLAIVGDNGAGKTTLVKLLTRLYDPSDGRILIDGGDLLEFDPASWRSRIAVIFQDFVRYELSAADNVGFGGVMRIGDRDLLERAAKKVRALELIEKLPEGWETVLSRQYEGGVDLSGGEWQRIALARALFAVGAGAGVLVLDEPTANLDVRSEAELFDRFLELTRGLTTILISHRFSSVRRADHICVLEGGKVLEQGDHEYLMSLGGRYAYTFNLQASRFKEEQEKEQQEGVTPHA